MIALPQYTLKKILEALNTLPRGQVNDLYEEIQREARTVTVTAPPQEAEETDGSNTRSTE